MRLRIFLVGVVAIGLSACGPLLSRPSRILTPASVAISSAGVAQWVPAPQVASTALGLLASAQHSVVLDMYELGNPALVAALVADHARGLTVRVILDATESQSATAGRAGGGWGARPVGPSAARH